MTHSLVSKAPSRLQARRSALALAVATLACMPAAQAQTTPDPYVYKPTVDWQFKQHGTLVLNREVAGSLLTAFTKRGAYASADALKNLKAVRVAYATTAPDASLNTFTPGRPVLATGIVIVDTSKAWTKTGQRPIIIFAPKTQGLGRDCAPSRALELAQEEKSEVLRMAAALNEGYAIAVTDYDGYTENSQAHQYLVGQALGHAVLDMALATRQLLQQTTILSNLKLSFSSPMAIWGYSEGGSGAAWAGELMESYAPVLTTQVKGIASGSPVASVAQAAKSLDSGPGSGMMLMGVWGFHVAYPKPLSAGGLYFELNDNFKSDLLGDFAAIKYELNPPSGASKNALLHPSECVDQLPLDQGFKSMYWRNKGINGSGPLTITEITTNPALGWKDTLDKNDPGNHPINVPFFYYHGSVSTTVNTNGTAKEGDFILSAESFNNYYDRVCKNGTKVFKQIYASTNYGDSNHETTSDKAFPAVINWFDFILNNQPLKLPVSATIYSAPVCP
jgi:hypothetical protein